MSQWATTMQRAVAAIFVVILAVTCTNHHSEAVQYATSHASSIVTSTRPLWIKYTAVPAYVPESEYTPDIRALKANFVDVKNEGVWMYINSVYPYVTGIFVRFDRSFPTPGRAAPDTVQITYERLGPDVYWFSRPR